MKNIYPIYFDKVDFEGLKEVFTAIKNVTELYDTQFMLVGALVRVLFLEVVHEIRVHRETKDIDFAIALSDWDQYNEIINVLLQIEEFEKDPKQIQRLIYNKKQLVDIIPFGDITDSRNQIRWPPNGDMVLSILGFEEVYEHSIIFEFDGELSIHAASLEGLVILKVFAWNDRKHVTIKDAIDLGIIFHNYFDVNIYEIYDVFWRWIEGEGENFDSLKLGAKILGYKIGQILQRTPETKSQLLTILDTELANEEYSNLILCMEGNSEQDLQYEENYNLILMLLEGLKIERI